MHYQKKVLIIDDEIDLCLLLKSYLLRKDYDVYLSHNLEQGVPLIDEMHPEILFLDNNLPDGIGWAAAPELAKRYPSMFIVLISAFHPTVPTMPLHARYKCIEKPISIADLDMQFSDIDLF